jgi:archaemetzincin
MKQFQFYCLLLLLHACSGIEKESLVIGIQPYGQIDDRQVQAVADHIRMAFSAEVVVMEPRDLPIRAFIQVKSPRYRADLLLCDLKRIKPDSIEFLLGLTSSDMSTTKRNSDGTIKEPASKYADWGVFGLGYRPGPTCVVSTFRLKSDPAKFKDRLFKVCTHELGHNLGLKHCDSEGCVMQDAAETIKTIDRVDWEFCLTCKRQASLR